MKPHPALPGAALAVIVACVLGWQADRQALLAAWLAAWWCCMGVLMGGLVQVWLHTLTGGAWGEAIRAPLLAVARHAWLVALLFLPVLLGMHQLYPWTHGVSGARWPGELSAPAFKEAWLQPAAFAVRSVLWLALWCALAALSRRPRLSRSAPFAAAALIVYCASASLAAVDWIMSLTPLWYSSVFGLLVLVAQALGGMAFSILLVLRGRAGQAMVLPDLGNLLLAWVMSWAYLAFMQFLVIWAEDLPHEIVWYTARAAGAWPLVAWLLALLLFALPALLLLFRGAKRAPHMMQAIAALVLAMSLVDAWWLVLPSVPGGQGDWWWAAPLGAAAVLTALVLPVHWRAVSGERS
jgi:hypothetical protein